MGKGAKIKKARNVRKRHLLVLGQQRNAAVDAYQRQASGLAERASAAASDHNPPCKSGCYGCCYQIINITVPDALLILRHLNNAGRFTEAMIRRWLEEAQHISGKTHAEHFAAKRPCVFLEDGRCSVYQSRPVLCATYWVSDKTDPADCYPDAGKDPATLHTLTADIEEVVALAGKFTPQIAPEVAGNVMGPMPIVLLAVMDWLRNGAKGGMEHWLRPTAAVESRDAVLDEI